MNSLRSYLSASRKNEKFHQIWSSNSTVQGIVRYFKRSKHSVKTSRVFWCPTENYQNAIVPQNHFFWPLSIIIHSLANLLQTKKLNTDLTVFPYLFSASISMWKENQNRINSVFLEWPIVRSDQIAQQQIPRDLMQNAYCLHRLSVQARCREKKDVENENCLFPKVFNE